MSSLNRTSRPPSVLNEVGEPVRKPGTLQELRRCVMTTALWEDSYSESGEEIATRMKRLIAMTMPSQVSNLAIEARTVMKLRHVPLLIARYMVQIDTHRPLVARTLEKIIQRPDEMAEFLAIYWKDGRCPLAKQVQRGLAKAFNKFDEFSIAKYNHDNRAIKLKDVALLAHVDPKDKTGRGRKLAAVDRKNYKRGEVLRHKSSTLSKLIEDNLMTPDTHEVAISAAGKDKALKNAEWARLLSEGKLGAMALIRNLRNMLEAGIEPSLLRRAIDGANVDKLLPFRFISAARMVPTLSSSLEAAMYRCTAAMPRLKGKTALVIDTSPSMWEAKISEKSDMFRFDAAAALAILAREVCEKVQVYTFNTEGYRIPSLRGFDLLNRMSETKNSYSFGGKAVDMANADGYDRIIVLTDGQWHVADGTTMASANDISPIPLTNRAYMLNVANNKCGVGYGRWTNIDGWSENVISYIIASEE